MRRSAYMVAVAALVAFPLSVEAQRSEVERSTTISVSGGAMQYELQGGTGTTSMAALRVSVPFGRVFAAEFGAIGAFPRQDVGMTALATDEGNRALLLVAPEAQIQVHYPAGRIAPYLGVGGGLVMDRADRQDGESSPELSGSVSGGFRVSLAERLGGVAEVRARGFGQDFERRTTEFTVGLSWQLKPTRHLF